MSQLAREVELLAKQRPRQARAKRTYETILASAADLLVEVGVERISTNLIAERAGVTVPALYRYFPNKYAVLHALGMELMELQNAAFKAWLSGALVGSTPGELPGRVHEGLLAIYQVTREQPASVEIFHALRALVPLREQRMAARHAATTHLAEQLASWLGVELTAELQVKARVTVDASCALVEGALEDPAIDPEAYLREGAAMILSYWQLPIATEGAGPGSS